MTIACIVASLSIFRGPLNQAATSVQPNKMFFENGTMQVHIAQQLPEGYTAVHVYSRAPITQVAYLTTAFANVVQSYSIHSAMNVTHSECGDSCLTSINVNTF